MIVDQACLNVLWEIATQIFGTVLVQTILGLISFATFLEFIEKRNVTRQLRECVRTYVKSTAFTWKNQNREFILPPFHSEVQHPMWVNAS